MRIYTAKQLYVLLKQIDTTLELIGDGDTLIEGFSSLKKYKNGTITWIKNKCEKIENVDFTAVIITMDKEVKASVKFVCSNTKFLFFEACKILSADEEEHVVSPLAYVDKSSKLGKDITIGHYACIGKNVIIGDYTIIGAHVIVGDNTVIGKNCIIKPGAVIGERGFGYVKERKTYISVPHYGRVIIGNYVDIGSNSCIDRGTIDDTIISDGVKIDNLCHIAHNVEIKENSMIVANSMIAGSVQIGMNAYVAPSVSVINQTQIENNTICGIGSVVLKNVNENEVVAGIPAKKIRVVTDDDKGKY